jgi:hypothetical protein
MAKKEQPRQPSLPPEEHSLVPLYSPLDVSRGLRGYRRGNMILYTVRGRPDEVMDLIDELKGRGVGEIVALVSHRAGDADEDEPPAEDAEVVSKDE